MRLTRLIRTLISACLLAGVCIAPGDSGQAAQRGSRATGDDTKASQLLRRAHEIVEIKDPAIGPFHLVAKVRLYGLPHNAASLGTYTLDWAAPSRYREEFNFPGYTESGVAVVDKLWRQRNVPYRPLRLWQLSQLLDVTSHIRFVPTREGVFAVSDEISDGAELTCIVNLQGERGYTRERSCLDTLGRPVFVELAWPGVTELYHYSNYQPYPQLAASPSVELGRAPSGGATALAPGPSNLPPAEPAAAKDAQRFYPRAMRYSWGATLDIDVQVQQLSLLDASDASLFAPLQGVAPQAWCADETPAMPAKKFKLGYGAPRTGRVTLQLEIAADGRIRDAYILESMDVATDADARKIAKSSRFIPASCHGVPVESETTLTLHFFP